MDIPYLDIQNLHLSSELQNFVLDFPDLQRISVGAGCSSNLRIKICGFRSFCVLSHGVYSIEDVRGHSAEVGVGKRVNEDGIRLLLGLATYAVGDLEVRIALGR